MVLQITSKSCYDLINPGVIISIAIPGQEAVKWLHK